MINPDHRALALSEGAAPQNDVETAFVSLLGGEQAPDSVVYAKDIYEDSYKSEVLEAFILANADDAHIEKVLRVPADVTAVYRKLFFDRGAFKDELDVEAYAQTYPELTAEEKYGKSLKVSALALGLEYLTYRFSRGNAGINIGTALQSMIETAYVLSQTTKLNPLDSNAAREARSWAGTAIKAMEAYVKVQPATESTTDEFRLALATIERTTNEAASNIKKDEIVH